MGCHSPSEGFHSNSEVFAPFNALIIDSFFIFGEQRSLKQSHTHFSYRSKFFIRYILLVRPRKLIARCAILSHEPKITEATLVSSPPRSPPSEEFHLATTFHQEHERKCKVPERKKNKSCLCFDTLLIQSFNIKFKVRALKNSHIFFVLLLRIYFQLS